MEAGFAIRAITADHPGIEALRAEARREGFVFLDRLADEWTSGANRFDRPGEGLLGAFAGGELVGIGGLTRDPFAQGDGVGRLRRLYVRPLARRLGVGAALVAALTERARPHFSRLRLRTDTAGAATFYLARGFVALDEEGATHGRALR